MLSVKSAIGVPVPTDARVSDVLQRSLRVCLFYQPPKEELEALTEDGAAQQPDHQDYFLGNSYQTLATRHSGKEECWLFPSSGGSAIDHRDKVGKSDRKFLLRTDFGDPNHAKARVSLSRFAQ
jgi:hypothetical protein